MREFRERSLSVFSLGDTFLYQTRGRQPLVAASWKTFFSSAKQTPKFSPGPWPCRLLLDAEAAHQQLVRTKRVGQGAGYLRIS